MAKAKTPSGQPETMVAKSAYQSPKRVRITEGTSVVFNDEPYSGGDEITMEGPSADAMVMNGYAELVDES